MGRATGVWNISERPVTQRTRAVVAAQCAVILAAGLTHTQAWAQPATIADGQGTCVFSRELRGRAPLASGETKRSLGPPSEVISQLTDPQQPGIDGAIDIMAASIEQSGGLLTFIIEAREPIPATLPDPDDSMTFLWLVDADNDPGTGQPHGGVGSDFNVRAVVSENWGGAFIDVAGTLPGGGGGRVVLIGNRVEMTIGLSQIASPAQFTWRGDAFQNIGGVGSGNGETAIATATTLPFTAPARVTVTPPLLMLSPSGPATGQLNVELRDADGTLLDNADFNLTYVSSYEDVATVDAAGVVTALSVPVEFWQTPYIDVYAEGVKSDNAAVVRSTATDLGVIHSYYAGRRVSFYLPDVIDGVDLGQLTADFQIVEATDHAYDAQQIATGLAPFGGGTHYFVLDVSDDPNTVPCGLAGNPVRLGWDFGVPVHNTCYIVNDPANRVPQWFVIFHEMGHNFTLASRSFSEFAAADPAHDWVYVEGLASLAAMWSWASIIECGSGLEPTSLESLDSEFSNIKVAFADALAAYQSAGADYATLDPDILDGLLFELYDSYGAKVWFDLFSTFLPADEPLSCVLDTEAKQATWFVAAISASVGQDLRSTFVTDYGFPIDNVAWSTILGCVQDRISARDFNALDLDTDGIVTPCDAASIPAVSEWGMIAMTLMVLTTGTVLLGRGRQSHAAM